MQLLTLVTEGKRLLFIKNNLQTIIIIWTWYSADQ